MITARCPWGTGNVNLRGHTFNTDEANWILQQVDNKVPIKAICERFNINRRTVTRLKWWRNHKTKERRKNGRPKTLNEASGAILVASVEKAMSNGNAMQERVFRRKVRYLQCSTARAQQLNSRRLCCDHTLHNIMKEHNLCMRNAQVKSNARMVAERDIRNAISTAVLFRTAASLARNPFMIINYDATQVGFGSTGKMKVIVPKLIKCMRRSDRINTAESERQKLTFAAKYFAIINAAGGFCKKEIYLIANESVKPGDVYCLPIPGLSPIVDLEGYICVCHSRAGNVKFFEWLNKQIIIPYAIEMRQRCAARDNQPAFVFCDGEQAQIDGALACKESACNVVMAKLPGSTTAVSQPCDAAHLFSSLKAHSKKKESWPQEQRLVNSIRTALLGFEKDNEGIKWRPRDRENIVETIMRIHVALPEALTSHEIKNSFITAGFNDLEMCAASVKTDRVFAQYHQNLTDPESFNFDDNVTQADKLFQRNGQLRDSDMCQWFECVRAWEACCGDPSAGDRADRTLSQQRAVILNHTATTARLLAIQEAADAKEVAAKEARKTRLASQQLKKAASREKKRQTAQKKAAKARRSSLRSRVPLTEAGQGIADMLKPWRQSQVSRKRSATALEDLCPKKLKKRVPLP